MPDPTPSAVITRESGVPENLSSGVETYVPRRLLYGLLPETLLDERSKAQLQTENEALQKEFETMVDQAKEAEGRMLEISNLSHLFASKIEQQSTEVEQLYAQAEVAGFLRGE